MPRTPILKMPLFPGASTSIVVAATASSLSTRLNYISPILLLCMLPFSCILATSMHQSEPFIKEYYYRPTIHSSTLSPFTSSPAVRSPVKRNLHHTNTDHRTDDRDSNTSRYRYSSTPSPLSHDTSVYDDEPSSSRMHSSSLPKTTPRSRDTFYQSSSSSVSSSSPLSSSSSSFSRNHHNLPTSMDINSPSRSSASSSRDTKKYSLRETSHFTIPLRNGERDVTDANKNGNKKDVTSKQMYPYESSRGTSESDSESYSYSKYPSKSEKRHFNTRDSSSLPSVSSSSTRGRSDEKTWTSSSRDTASSKDYTEPQYHPSYDSEVQRSRKRNNEYPSLKGNHGTDLSRGSFSSSFDAASDDKNTFPGESQEETWYSLKIPLTPVASKGHQSRDSSESAGDVSSASSSSSSGKSKSVNNVGLSSSRRKSSNSNGASKSRSSVNQYYTTTQVPERGHDFDSHDGDTNIDHQHTRNNNYDEKDSFNYRHSDKQVRDNFENHSPSRDTIHEERINHGYDSKTTSAGGKSTSRHPSSHSYRMIDSTDKDTHGSKSYFYTKSSVPSSYRPKGQNYENNDHANSNSGSYSRHSSSDDDSSTSYNSNNDANNYDSASAKASRDVHSFPPPPPPPPPSSPVSSESSRKRNSRVNSGGGEKWSEKVAHGFKSKSNYRPDDRPPIEQDEDIPILPRTINSPPQAASVSVYHQQNQSSNDDGDNEPHAATSSPPRIHSSDSRDHRSSSLREGTSRPSHVTSRRPNISNSGGKQAVKSIQDILDTVRSSET